MTTVETATVTKIDDVGVWVKIPRLTGDLEYGPCRGRDLHRHGSDDVVVPVTVGDRVGVMRRPGVGDEWDLVVLW